MVMVGLIAASTSSGIKEMDSNYIELMNKNGNRFFIRFFAGGDILKAEIIRLVARLRVLEQHSIGVEGLVDHDSYAVIAVHIQQFFVPDGGMLHRDAPFAGDDLHSEHIFNKIIDGMGCDFLRQSGHKFLQK